MHCPGWNATDAIWRVLASSDGISSWSPLKHSNPNPLANQLWCFDFLTPPTPLIIPYRLYAFLESLMPLKNWFSIHAKCIPYVSLTFLPSLNQDFIAYRSSEVSWRPDCIFEIHQLWQSGFSRVYSNSCCSCSLEREIIKIGQSSHKIYSKTIVNFQESTTILNASTKKSGNLLKASRISYIFLNTKSTNELCKKNDVHATLFNGYSMPNPSLKKHLWDSLTHSWCDKGFMTLPKGISLKVNITTRREFELTYGDIADQYINHYAKEIKQGNE